MNHLKETICRSICFLWLLTCWKVQTISRVSLAAHQAVFSNGRAICPPLFPCEGFSWHTGMLYLHRRHSEITLSRQLPKVVGYGLWLDVLCVWIRWKYLEKHRSHTKCHTKWTANIWLEVNIFSGINSCDQLTPNLFQLLMQKRKTNLRISS